MTFVMYLLTAIVGFGGFGVWAEIVQRLLPHGSEGYDGVYRAISTFYPALIGSASFQFFLLAIGDTNKALPSFVVTISLAAFGFALLLSIFHDQYPTARFFFAIVLTTFSVWLWIITEADNPIYKTGPVDVASGGNVDRGLKGNLGDFEAD